MARALATGAVGAGWSAEVFAFVRDRRLWRAPRPIPDFAPALAWSVPYLPSPVMEYLNFVAPAVSPTSQMRSRLAPAGVRVGIAGANQTCMPFVVHQLPFYCWTASALRTEWGSLRDFRNVSLRGVRKSLNMGPLAEFHYAIETWVYRKARRVLALSEYTRKTLIAQYGLPANHVDVLYCPVDLHTFRPPDGSDRRPAGLPDRYIFSALRVYDRRKNLPLLVDAFSRLVRSGSSDLRLVIAGYTPHDGSHLAIVERAGVADRVQFLGLLPREQIVSLYQWASAVVLASREEGLAITLLESLACGTPVVSTRSGGPEEILAGNDVGLLADHTADSLAGAIALLMDNRELRQRMGIAGRCLIAQRFSPDAFWARFRLLTGTA